MFFVGGSVDQKLALNSAASVIDRGRAGGRAVTIFGLLFFNNCDFFCVVSKYFCSIVRCCGEISSNMIIYVINTIE